MNAEPVNYVTLTEEKATRINKSETDKIKTRFKKVVFGLSVFEATVTLAIISLASVLVVTQGCQNSKPSDKAESSRGFYYHLSLRRNLFKRNSSTRNLVFNFCFSNCSSWNFYWTCKCKKHSYLCTHGSKYTWSVFHVCINNNGAQISHALP